MKLQQRRGYYVTTFAFSGAFYAYCTADNLGVRIVPEQFRKLIQVGMAVKRQVMESSEIKHPFEDDLGFLSETIIDGSPFSQGADSSNVCIVADRRARPFTNEHGHRRSRGARRAKRRLALGEPFVVESLIGTRFSGRAVRETGFGGYAAVFPLNRRLRLRDRTPRDLDGF
jgi:trans-L-3-hydroxyproline dehydratase